MGPGLNAVCVGREEQNDKSDLPHHGRGEEGGEEVEPRRGRQERRSYPHLSDQISPAQAEL